MSWIWDQEAIQSLTAGRDVTHLEIHPSNSPATPSPKHMRVMNIPVHTSRMVPVDVIVALNGMTVSGHIRRVSGDVHDGDVPGCPDCCMMDVMET